MEFNENLFLEKYNEGLKDSEIARFYQISESRVNQMRWKLQLSPNGRNIISDELFFELYNKGLWDCEIARQSGASEAQIRRKREKFCLKKNDAKPELIEFPKESFINYYNNGLTDEEIARIMHRTVKIIAGYR